LIVYTYLSCHRSRLKFQSKRDIGANVRLEGRATGQAPEMPSTLDEGRASNRDKKNAIIITDFAGKLFKKSFPLAFQKFFSMATPAELQIILEL
jgi:hypothetical protein